MTPAFVPILRIFRFFGACSEQAWRSGRLLGGATLLLVLAACANVPPVDPQVRQALAPTGSLRVGVYEGSPTSMVTTPQGEKVGLAHDLGKELARRLGVPFERLEFARVSDIVEALKAGVVDITFTNASPARARELDFSPALIDLELGYLLPAGSRISAQSQIDQAGLRIGVAQGSTSQSVLTREFKQARVVPLPSVKVGVEQLAQGQLDAFATNKAILFEMADAVPGSRVLEGRWGLDHLALAIPQGRDVAHAYLREFSAQVRQSGLLAELVKKAGLRGTAATSQP